MDFSSINLENRVLPSSNKLLSQTTNNRSDFVKRMRSESTQEDEFLISKLAKTHCSDVMQHGSSPLLSLSTGTQTKMLSFSNPGSESFSLTKNGGFGQISEFPHYGYTVNTGYGSGVHAPVMDCGPFTASQWVELQHQALVYKYIQANVAVPSSLLLGIKKSVSPYLFSGFNSGAYSYTPNTWGWGGSFHLGFSGNNTDPEPGRCRRTDGKKWRCSRDAVLEQKYCERHLNRGRHRSRKLVEGRSGQAAAAVAAATSAPRQRHSVDVPVFKGSQTCAAADDHFGSRVKLDRMGDDQGLSGLNPATDSKSKDPILPIQEHSRSDFGLVSSDSFLNPSIKTTGLDPIMMDSSDRTTWPGELNPDWTQLSMSIPTSSPRDKLTLSPLSLSWGSSIGGPLGEVLLNNNTSNGSWFGSSPTGVLQKTDFRSLSNSSSGSSPRGERTKMEDDVFGTHLTTSMFLPS